MLHALHLNPDGVYLSFDMLCRQSGGVYFMLPTLYFSFDGVYLTIDTLYPYYDWVYIVACLLICAIFTITTPLQHIWVQYTRCVFFSRVLL